MSDKPNRYVWNHEKIQKVTEDGLRIVVDINSGRVTNQPPGVSHERYEEKIRTPITLYPLLTP